MPPDSASDASDEAPSSPEGSEEPALLYRVPIHEWDESDQPREKLLTHGPTVLSDAEVLALLLGSGTRTSDGPVSAVELGRALLQSYGSLHEVSQRKPKELTRTRGVGPAKATKLAAAFEAGRRVESQRQQDERMQVTCPADVADYGPLLRDLDKEVFKVVHLNTANVIIGDYTVSEGGLSSSAVEPRGGLRAGHPRRRGRGHLFPQPSLRQPRAQPRGHSDHPAACGGRRHDGHSGARPPYHRRHQAHVAGGARGY